MEAALALRRARHISLDDAHQLVGDFMAALQVTEIDITLPIGSLALAAYQKYGKPHGAQLNMGDCFAYACAKSLSVPLLYKGNDFALTDIG